MLKRQLCIATVAWCLGVPAAQVSQIHPDFFKENAVHHATGPFDVKLAPQKDEGSDPSIGRMLLDKEFHGELEAHSLGQMLYGKTAVEGSQAAVAIEKVTGTLGGRKGSFMLYHTGVMVRGKPVFWSVTVVPDSGTDQLTGLDGKMKIIVAEGGKHSYDLEYSLPNPQ